MVVLRGETENLWVGVESLCTKGSGVSEGSPDG